MNNTTWITGISGFSGYHLAEFLFQLPNRPSVVGIDMRNKCTSKHDVYLSVDLTKPDQVKEAALLYPPEYIIHLAGVMPPADEEIMWQINVGGSLGLLQGLFSAGKKPKKILGIGSAAEYLHDTDAAIVEDHSCNPVSAYGRSKLGQSFILLSAGRSFDLPVVIARPFNLMGPGLSENLVLGRLCKIFSQNEPVDPTIGNIDSKRDFLDIRDAVRAYWDITKKGTTGEIYNVCTGLPTSIRMLIKMLSEITGKKISVNTDEARVRINDPLIVIGDNYKVRTSTGWTPRIDLMQSLRDMIESVSG